MAPFRPSAGPITPNARPSRIPTRLALTKKAAHALKRCLDNNIRPLDIITEQAMVNAFVLDVGMGGSTNTILHTLALAHEAGIKFDLNRINEISQNTPHICKISPSRPEVHVEHVHQHGGIPAILKELNRHGVRGLNLDVPTVTGKLADAVACAPNADGDVIRTAENAFTQTGGLAILFGNLAPKGAVVKVAGVAADMMEYEGTARIFESQEDALAWHPPRQGEGWRRGGDSLRRTARRTGHAGNALANRGNRGRRYPLRADHRRPLLRRHARALCLSRRAGSRGPRPHRGDSVRATAFTSTPRPARSN